MNRSPITFFLLFFWGTSYAASQQYQEISLSNRQELRQKFNSGTSINSFKDVTHAISWIGQQSFHLRNKIPDDRKRRELLRMIHYEATRYQLDPDLVLALIEVESGFNRFALSHVGASGLMQVMPFWKGLIGSEKDSLFDVQTNLRYGCIILRHYLDIENNNLERGLARYNGSLGSDTYPSMVLGVWRSKFRYASS
ncbi:lytic transglycosylase domain-containing protein [Polynucleobacter sp. AP-Kolm-20A-A1]|uniref:lytic transglycosylase domain-containing protein n=1 Tax=Polynucleobacter sp. AP-Kolm-20A-A1 TaxID=2081041 RepID=UPI001BFD38C1|nr:transglycosylase SLT domain-containing protein [Polynucleobacter sp. AP-Kolm-20A-A1]QWE21465.1 transglycosylase SLT domain-containing protein [Polynucleobacter sp. AP-Kolm-20A-A1]